MKLTTSLALLTQALLAMGADTNSWKSRTIYFALTDRIARNENDNGGGACGNLQNYCGGTFKGLQSKLDYIKGMGFDAIWITPVVENSDGGYHGYWAKDLYSINSHHGTSDELKNLVSAAHDKGMYMMVDVVANHMGNGPISENKPDTLSHDSSYHPACDIDYNNQQSIEVCRVGNVLPDINTTDPSIRQLYQDWIKWLMSTYNFDGVRIDTVKHVEKDFWPDFAWASGAYTIGEVLSGDPNYFAGYSKLMGGLLNYPIYYPLNRFYQQQDSPQALVDMHNQIASLVPDAATLGTFLDNHDQPRFLSEKNDVSLFKNALTYVMLGRGIPIVYYGSEQGYAGGGDPQNREDLWRSGFNTTGDMYTFLQALGGVRKSHGGLPGDDHVHLFVQGDAYAWSRQDGAVVALTSNIGQGQQRQFCFFTQQNNKSWRGIFDGKTYTSGDDGKMCATVNNGEPMVFIAQ
ncbi:alpha-amylase A type-3 precursor [Cordyceps javanica]|uniref:Alpha-amylase A type-3 n=1 Tax=Cordyceps javanica TaxID=43265 RepID=A0A545V7A5_9HYPO|nr:alpha-amylase A type-3 precursor [Cordyceps javanica]TQW09249.1 alpha-amylase A type-3 precursor [Cordyceps javanica]